MRRSSGEAREVTKMAIEFVREGGALIARAEDRVDGANAKAFQEELESVIDENDHTVILDLEKL